MSEAPNPILAQLIRAVPRPTAPEIGFDCRDLIHELAQGMEPASPRWSQVESFCEVISHGRRPCRQYDDQGKAVRAAGALDDLEYIFGIAALLHCSQVAPGCEEEERGAAFTCLNAALTALDAIAEKGSPEEEAELRSWARDNLDRLMASLVV